MNRIFLFLVMLPSSLWKLLGADTEQLRAILDVRLTLDNRNPVSIGRGRQRSNRKYGILFNIYSSLLFGCFYTIVVWVVKDRIFSMAIYFTSLILVITFMLITDFSNVLFDTRDKFILYPRPINDRTLVLAKLLHVFIYLFRIIFPMALPAWIVLGYLDGWKSVVLFPLPLLMMVFLVLFIVNGVYLIVLRVSKPEKFKDVINYFQVITSVVFFATVYLMPRFFRPGTTSHINIINFGWLKYTPGYWLAVCWAWIGYPVTLQGTSYLSLLAILLPITCVFVLVRKLAPEFSRQISGIDAVEQLPLYAKTQQSGKKAYEILSHIFNKSDEGKAGFMIAWIQTSRSRSFRMRVYPTLAYVPLYFFYLLSSSHNSSFQDEFRNLSYSNNHLLLLYMSSIVMVSSLSYMTVSEQYKAAWVYFATPVEKPGYVLTGAFKALWVKFFLPFFIILATFVLYVWGSDSIADIALSLVNVTLFSACTARISYRYLPFSMFEQTVQSGNRIFRFFFTMIIPMALGGLHYFATHFLWLKILFLCLSIMLLWVVWDSYLNTTWDTLYKSEQE